MTSSSSSDSARPLPSPSPTTSSPGSGAPVERPWWGPVDVLLSIPVWLVSGILGVVIGSVVASAAGYEIGDDIDLPAFSVFIATLILQLGQGAWPWVVSRWKGLGLAEDWGFRFSFPGDIGWGFLVSIICVIAATAATQGMAALVGLEDTDDASNTSVITDNEDSLWIIGVIALVTIGAPLTEELLFRGLILRVFEKYFGVVAAVLGSTLLFTIPHVQAGATADETWVLLAAIAAIGLVLSVTAVRFGRIGPTIIAHFFFNAFGSISALFAS